MSVVSQCVVVVHVERYSHILCAEERGWKHLHTHARTYHFIRVLPTFLHCWVMVEVSNMSLLRHGGC